MTIYLNTNTLDIPYFFYRIIFKLEIVCYCYFLLTNDHLEALRVVLYKRLSLHCLWKERFRDQWEANTAQNLHDVLLSVTHVVLQPAHCCIVNLQTNTTPVKLACILLYLNTAIQTWASARTVSLSWCSIYVSCVTSSCRNSSSLYTSVKWSWIKSSTAAFNSGQSMHSARAEMPTRRYKKRQTLHHFHIYFIIKLNIIKCLEVSILDLFKRLDSCCYLNSLLRQSVLWEIPHTSSWQAQSGTGLLRQAVTERCCCSQRSYFAHRIYHQTDF